MTRPATGRVTGHVKTIERREGLVFYMKTRVPGRVPEQTTTKIGPAWTNGGRPPAGYFTRKQAQEALDEFLADARRGTIAGLEIKRGHTFGDAVAEWLRWAEHDKQNAPSTMADYRNVARCYLLPEFGEDTALEDVTKRRIERFRARMLDGGKLSRRSIQKIMVLLYGVMKRAVRNEWIATNPADNVDRVTVKRSGDFNVLSPTEVHAVARKTEGLFSSIIVVAAFTGLRLGEFRALRWCDVDFAAQTIRVRRNLPSHGGERTPKSGKVRSVPLIDQAAVELDKLSRREHFTGPEDRVFCSVTGGPIDPDEIRDNFYGALDGAGLGRLRDGDDPIVVHDLRHTFGTLAVQVWPLTDVQHYMGHADIATTMIYVHHVPKATAANELSAVVAASMGAAEAPAAHIRQLQGAR